MSERIIVEVTLKGYGSAILEGLTRSIQDCEVKFHYIRGRENPYLISMSKDCFEMAKGQGESYGLIFKKTDLKESDLND